MNSTVTTVLKIVVGVVIGSALVLWYTTTKGNPFTPSAPGKE